MSSIISFYKVDDANLKCVNCGHDKLVQFSHDITCTKCGCEQGYGNFVNDNSHHISFEDHPVKLQSSSIPTRLFDELSFIIPDQVIEYAKVIYERYQDTSPNPIRGDKQRAAFTLASIYYSSRAFSPIAPRTLMRGSFDNITDADLSKASNAIKEVLGTHHDFRKVIIQNASYDITSDINRTLAKLTSIPESTKQDMRKTIFKIADKISPKISTTPSLSTLPQSTIAATIVLIAARIKRTPITLKTFAAECGITSVTLTKTSHLLTL